VNEVEMRTDDPSKEQGAALIVALLLMVLLFSLGASLLAVSETENEIAANDQWSEGAFGAAEAAVQVALDQLTRDEESADEVVDVTGIGDSYSYRSGGRNDAEPQPPELVGTTPATGYSYGSTTGYTSSGYVFRIYQINGTGNGPRNARREVEVQVEIGPVAL